MTAQNEYETRGKMLVRIVDTTKPPVEVMNNRGEIEKVWTTIWITKNEINFGSIKHSNKDILEIKFTPALNITDRDWN